MSTPTPEQLQVVHRIIKARSLYDVLSLDESKLKGVNAKEIEKEVKKGYRKLALATHPDKNKAPDAEEAFKKVSRAYQMLTDADAKRYICLYTLTKVRFNYLEFLLVYKHLQTTIYI